MKKIGEILLDTGILLIGDLTNLKKIKQTPHSANRRFIHLETQQAYTQNVDFKKYSDVLADGKTVNELIQAHILKEVSTTNDTELSSENIINGFQDGIRQLRFENGTDGKALALLLEEGVFPVFVETDEHGISKLIIAFR